MNDKFDFDNTLLKASMRVILQPLVEECDKIIDECSETQQDIPENLKKRIHQVLRNYKLKYLRKCILAIGRRVAIVIMVLITSMTVACVSIKPLRENIYNAIITWYDEYFSFSFNEDVEQELDSNTNIVFEYIPEGFSITNDMAANGYREVQITNDESRISFLQRPYNDEEDLFDEQFTVREKIKINDYDVIYISREEDILHVFTWIYDGYWYRLTSDFDKNELIKIIENIK